MKRIRLILDKQLLGILSYDASFPRKRITTLDPKNILTVSDLLKKSCHLFAIDWKYHHLIDIYIGNYQLSENESVEVFKENEKVFLRPSSSSRPRATASMIHDTTSIDTDIELHDNNIAGIDTPRISSSSSELMSRKRPRIQAANINTNKHISSQQTPTSSSSMTSSSSSSFQKSTINDVRQIWQQLASHQHGQEHRDVVYKPANPKGLIAAITPTPAVKLPSATSINNNATKKKPRRKRKNPSPCTCLIEVSSSSSSSSISAEPLSTIVTSSSSSSSMIEASPLTVIDDDTLTMMAAYADTIDVSYILAHGTSIHPISFTSSSSSMQPHHIIAFTLQDLSPYLRRNHDDDGYATNVYYIGIIISSSPSQLIACIHDRRLHGAAAFNRRMTLAPHDLQVLSLLPLPITPTLTAPSCHSNSDHDDVADDRQDDIHVSYDDLGDIEAMLREKKLMISDT